MSDELPRARGSVSSITGTIASLAAATPIAALFSSPFPDELRGTLANLGVRLPWLTEFMVDLRGSGVALIAVAIATSGVAACWALPLVARPIAAMTMLVAQAWWTAAVLTAYLLPLLRIVETLGKQT